MEETTSPAKNSAATEVGVRRRGHDVLTAVVLMTAHGTRETTAEALALGAYDVMAKPFDVARVESVLCEAQAAATH